MPGLSGLASEQIDCLLCIPALLWRHFGQVRDVVVVGMTVLVLGCEFDDNSMCSNNPIVTVAAFLVLNQQTDGNLEMLVHFFQTQGWKAPIPKRHSSRLL